MVYIANRSLINSAKTQKHKMISMAIGGQMTVSYQHAVLMQTFDARYFSHKFLVPDS